MASAAEIARALGHGRERSNGHGGFLTFCPIHEADGSHNTPSLDLDERNGKVLWVCRSNGPPHGSCTNKLIADELRARGLLATRNGMSQNGARARLVKTYDYVDESGALLYQVCRFEPKKFLQRQQCSSCAGTGCGACKNSGWIWNLRGVRRVLYNLPLLLETAQGVDGRPPKGIAITEGEKDADNLFEACGFITTTNSEGAEKWHHDFNQYFRGRRVVIFPDADQKGDRHSLIVARNLKDVASEIKIVRLPGLGEKGDVSDWIEQRRRAGKNPDEMRREMLGLVEQAQLWTDTEKPLAITPPGADDPTLIAPAWSEDLIALRFVGDRGKDFRFVAAWGRWMAWDGARWERDETLTAYNAVRDHCRKVAGEAFLDSDGDAGPKVAKGLASARSVSAVEKMASADRRIAATIDQWDIDPWQLNTSHGAIDLTTGEMKPARRENYFSKIVAAPPADYEDCPLWLGLLDRLMKGDAEMMGFIKRMVGYCLTGSTREQSLFFCYGEGGTGKGSIMNTVRKMLADYATSTQMETLQVTRGDRHPTEIADLKGARLVITTETGEGRWNEARIKQFTGGDPLKARYMHRDFFEFYPSFKLWISGNTEPRIRNVDRAIARRLLLVPFQVLISQEERDLDLGLKLEGEYPAILRWAINGCLEWQKIGLNPPEKVIAATGEYLESEDMLSSWLEERVERDDQCFTASSDLFSDWKAWADKRGEFVGTQRRLTQMLALRGFKADRDGIGRRGLRGLWLKGGQREEEQA